MNATAIRRTKFSNLARMPVSKLFIFPTSTESKDDIVTSEIPDAEAYQMVDERAYITKDEGDRRGWGYQTVDELIDFCDEMKSKPWEPTELFEMLANERGQKKRAQDQLHEAERRKNLLEQRLQPFLEADRDLQDELESAREATKSADEAWCNYHDDIDYAWAVANEAERRADDEHFRAEAGWDKFRVLVKKIGLGGAILFTAEKKRPKTFLKIHRGLFRTGLTMLETKMG